MGRQASLVPGSRQPLAHGAKAHHIPPSTPPFASSTAVLPISERPGRTGFPRRSPSRPGMTGRMRHGNSPSLDIGGKREGVWRDSRSAQQREAKQSKRASPYPSRATSCIEALDQLMLQWRIARPTRQQRQLIVNHKTNHTIFLVYAHTHVRPPSFLPPSVRLPSASAQGSH